MEPQGPPEVLFCELCNASVPIQDFESGRAVRHNGRAIGACCLGVLRGGAMATAAAPTAEVARPAGRHGHEARLLPLGVAMLGALAAATLFLDYRIDQANGRWQRSSDELATSLKSQAEVVQDISVRLDGVARRADLDRVQEQVAANEKAAGQGDEARQKDIKAMADAIERLRAAAAGVQARVEQQPDYGPSLAELRLQLQQQSVSLAQLLAQPRSAPPSAPSAPGPDAGTPPAMPGLPAALAHEIARLKDADAATRFDAVDQLLRSKDAQVLEYLLPMVKDVDTFVRRLTVEGLKDFHKPEVVDALIAALGDSEEFVRDTAWRSLTDLTGQKLPFDAKASRDARARAQQKWQEWWDKSRDTFGT